MVRPNPRKYPRESTRDQILDVARDLFVERGYEETTMRAIADRIDLTPTAIYHHFEGKSALLRELCVRDFGALAKAFQRIGRIADPVERLRRIGEAYVVFAIENPMQYRFMFMMQRPVPEDSAAMHLGDPSESAYGILTSSCVELIEDGRLREEFGDADEVARILWAAVHGIASLWIAKRDVDWIEFGDVRESTAKMVMALIGGMVREPVVPGRP